MQIKNFSGRFQISSAVLIFVTALYFAAVLNIPALREIFRLEDAQNVSDWLFLFSVPLVFLALLNAVFQIVSLPYIHKILIPVLILASAAVSYNSFFFNVYFDKNMLANVLQTDAAEASRMLSPSFAAWMLLLGVLPASLYAAVKVKYRVWWKELLVRAGAVLASLAVVGAAGAVCYKDYASFFRNHKAVTHLIVPSNLIGAVQKTVKDQRRANMKFAETGADAKMFKPDSYPHVTVIVLGETVRAQNWGLNGYAHQTTPLLSERQKNGKKTGEPIINFSDVSSCGTATAVSVPCMFSSMNRTDYDAVKAEHQDNLLDYLTHAGVRTVWIDNDSGCKGVCTRSEVVINIRPQLHPEYCTAGECLDNVMLPELDKVLELVKKDGRDTVIVLHTIGSHGPTYYERYTEKEKKFSPVCNTRDLSTCSREEIVSTYDNTIVYLDQFLDKVIGRIAAHDEWESVVYYISDHGESLGEKGLYLHGTPYMVAPEEQTKVPMMMWFSKSWAKNEPFDLECVEKNAGKAYSHDNFFHTVFSTMDMKMDSLNGYKKEMDILGVCSKPKKH